MTKRQDGGDAKTGAGTDVGSGLKPALHRFEVRVSVTRDTWIERLRW